MDARKTALLVDDDPTIADTLRAALIGRPVTLDVAYDLPTATRCLDSSRYDGLILDLCLPQGSGFDVLRHMRARHITLPTAVISRTLSDYVRDMLALEHVKLVLMKPVLTSLLVSTILGLCGIDASQEQPATPARDRRYAAAPYDLGDSDLLWNRL
jgi:DNA-binding response OmpR family regulator